MMRARACHSHSNLLETEWCFRLQRSKTESRFRHPGSVVMPPGSGRDVGVGQLDVLHGPGVRQLVLQRPVVTLEHRDEQREGEKRVRAELEERHVVVLADGQAFSGGEGQPGGPLRRMAVEQGVGHLPFPPVQGPARVLAVPLDELGIAVHREQELVQQVLTHSVSRSMTGRLKAPPSLVARSSLLSPGAAAPRHRAHERAPSGYQVKYASMVWNRSRVST